MFVLRNKTLGYVITSTENQQPFYGDDFQKAIDS